MKMMLLSYVLVRASLTLIKQLCSFGDVNCDHQITVSSEDQKREETNAGLYEPCCSNGACTQTSTITHAHVGGCALNAPLLAEEPVNTSTVLAQTEQTFPHMLKMKGSIRTTAPRFGMETVANG